RPRESRVARGALSVGAALQRARRAGPRVYRAPRGTAQHARQRQRRYPEADPRTAARLCVVTGGGGEHHGRSTVAQALWRALPPARRVELSDAARDGSASAVRLL